MWRYQVKADDTSQQDEAEAIAASLWDDVGWFYDQEERISKEQIGVPLSLIGDATDRMARKIRAAIFAAEERGARRQTEKQVHFCSGCHYRWEGDKAVELCGDCWRKGQAVILGYDVEQPPRCRMCGCAGMAHPTANAAVPTGSHCSCGRCRGYVPWSQDGHKEGRAGNEEPAE